MLHLLSLISMVCYSGHNLNNEPFGKQTKISKLRPFNDPTVFDHWNTKIVHYSDPHCILNCILILYLSGLNMMAPILNNRLWLAPKPISETKEY